MSQIPWDMIQIGFITWGEFWSKCELFKLHKFIDKSYQHVLENSAKQIDSKVPPMQLSDNRNMSDHEAYVVSGI